MDQTARWCTHGLVGILGVIGLLLAAGAVDRWTYVFDLAVAVFAVLYAFILVKQGSDALEYAAKARLRRAARMPRKGASSTISSEIAEGSGDERHLRPSGS